MSVGALFNLKTYLHTFLIQLVKEMKKIEYMAPEMEEIKLMHKVSLLADSDKTAPAVDEENVNEY